jgi:hypothetical protein
MRHLAALAGLHELRQERKEEDSQFRVQQIERNAGTDDSLRGPGALHRQRLGRKEGAGWREHGANERVVEAFIQDVVQCTWC